MTPSVQARWAVIAAPDAVWVRARRPLAVPPRARTVVLYGRGPRARARCRAAVRALGMMPVSEYVVLPTVDDPWHLIEDRPEALRWYSRHVLVAPPAGGVDPLAQLAARVARRTLPLLARWAPGRLIVAERP